MGTPTYMSPEQARGKPTDQRNDIWAFGALLYELFTGQMLFAGETNSDVIAAVLTRLKALPAIWGTEVVEFLIREEHRRPTVHTNGFVIRFHNCQDACDSLVRSP